MHPLYVFSFQEFGLPWALPNCGGWVVERSIPGTPYNDIMGCYPLFTCQDWSQLHIDLDYLKEKGFVSIALVIDPFGSFDLHSLRRCFDDVIPYKKHFALDLHKSIPDIVTKHHRYYARKALRKINVEVCLKPVEWLDDWVNLYGNLIKKYHIKGIRAFSRAAFADQLGAPGIVLFRATVDEVTIGMEMWYVQNDVAYSHLMALSHPGYDMGSAYALRWASINHFAQVKNVRWLNYGGGFNEDGTDGLSFFKKGWSSDTRNSYFCSRILNHEKYSEIVRSKGIDDTNYFPAYRKGEFP
jgi:hypothetical protein